VPAELMTSRDDFDGDRRGSDAHASRSTPPDPAHRILAHNVELSGAKRQAALWQE
jgi:hypothetical protein